MYFKSSVEFNTTPFICTTRPNYDVPITIIVPILYLRFLWQRMIKIVFLFPIYYLSSFLCTVTVNIKLSTYFISKYSSKGEINFTDYFQFFTDYFFSFISHLLKRQVPFFHRQNARNDSGTSLYIPYNFPDVFSEIYKTYTHFPFIRALYTKYTTLEVNQLSHFIFFTYDICNNFKRNIKIPEVYRTKLI